MCSCFVFLSCCSLLSFLEGLFLLIGLRQAAGLRFVVRLPIWMFYSLIKSYSIDLILFLLYHHLVWYDTVLQIRCYPLFLCWGMLMVGFWFVHGFSLNLIRSDSVISLILVSWSFLFLTLEMYHFEFKGKSSLPLWKWIAFYHPFKKHTYYIIIMFFFIM